MNKRDLTLLTALSGVLVVVLIAGEIHSKAQQHQQNVYVNKMNTHQGAQPVDTANSTPATKVAVADMNTIQFLTAVAGDSEVPKMVAIGSSGTKGVGVTDISQDWFSLLIGQLRSRPGMSKLKVENLGIYGATTSSLLTGSTLQQAISDKPNVVLLETCALTDWYQNIPENTSLSNLKAIVSKLNAGLPDSRIVLYSPNPTQDATNKAGSTYTDYLRGEKALAKSNGWDFIDVHTAMADTVTNGTYSLTQLLSDPYHPNVLGYQLWEHAMYEGMQHDSRPVPTQAQG